MDSERTYQFKALTDLWTGTVMGRNGQITDKPIPDRLITTGLLGSIRWWFEVLVRGLGGSACDPTDTKCEDRNHCVVCELFGCTGWARKFRFEVLDENGDAKAEQIKQNQPFNLRFTPLRPVRGEELALLDATLRLIAEYGAIGGKTVFKPTNESSRTKKTHHQDYGIVEIVNFDPPIAGPNVTEVKEYIFEERWRKPEPKTKDADFSWVSLNCFWFVDQKTLTRENDGSSSFNRVLGREESKACRDCGQVHNPPNKCPKTGQYPKRKSEHLVNGNDEISKWLAGSQQESKKVFSFKNPARTFGFVKPGKTTADTKKEFGEMKKRLDSAWGQNGWDFLTGDEIIGQLFAGKEGRS
jgi:CRISPR-associated protein Cmr1